MTQNTFSVHFVVRSNRVDKKGHAPIYARITINKQLLQFSINHKINPIEWDNSVEQAKLNSKSSSVINQAIESFKSRIYQAYSKIVATSEELTAEKLKEAFYGNKRQVKVISLIETATEHNRNFESMIGIKYSYGSYKNYKTSLKYLCEFVPKYFKKKDIPLELVNYRFCEAFYGFLTTEKKCKVNGANKQLQRLRKIVNYALKQGYLNRNPMASFTLQFTPVNKVALTIEEIGWLQQLDLKRDILQKVRDAFLLQCYTGLAYADIKQLSIENIHRDISKGYWIKMNRQKSKIAFSVPLLTPALAILEKYLSDIQVNRPLLPIFSNQKMNQNLKIIQELAGISKNLTTHLARHTFATTITLANGVPIETVSRMLGHTKLSTTQMYAKVLDSKIGHDMMELKQKMEKVNK
ncbi:MAG: site-specific integrase [Lacibacter sp.]